MDAYRSGEKAEELIEFEADYLLCGDVSGLKFSAKVKNEAEFVKMLDEQVNPELRGNVANIRRKVSP